MMTNTLRTLSDTMAVSLSLLCTIHCFMLPIVLSWLPAVLALNMQSEAFHLWMVLLVIPLSLYALSIGCKQHKRYHVLVFGFMGLSLLLSAIFFAHDYFGEAGEKVLTVTGSAFIALGHLLNYRLCRHNKNCNCVD